MENKNKDLKIKTSPADFEILASSFYTIGQEMGINIERTAKSPIFFSAHDFVVAIARPDGDLVSIAEYIPVLTGSCPFAIKAVNEYYKEDIHDGDIFLANDPYFLDAGNHMQDWCIITPVFYQEKHVFTIAVKAHQADTGGGVPGGYNPDAVDVWAEGLRIPPIRIAKKGELRRDVLNLIRLNVRLPEMQHSDLLCMMAATGIGAKRLSDLMEIWDRKKVETYIDDVLNYAESMMRQQVEKVPDGTYHSESVPQQPGRYNDASIIQCDMTIKGSDIVLDFTKCGPQVKEYVNSSIGNTYSCVLQALLSSLGKDIRREYRNQGCFRTVKIFTEKGTILHAVEPATQGNNTDFVAQQIFDVFQACLASAVPKEVSAGWGHMIPWVFSGIDPRRNKGYGSPDFIAAAIGAGAIWGTDGWSTNGPQDCSGTLFYPEIEILESEFPITWERWEFAEDSCGPGRWRGGCGVHNVWVADCGDETIQIANQADPYDYPVMPAIAGGKPPRPNSKKLLMNDGHWETEEDTRQKLLYDIHSGDKVVDYAQGGCGVGDPFERDVEAVQWDVRNEIVSHEMAKEEYGVFIDPKTFEIDQAATSKLRAEKRIA